MMRIRLALFCVSTLVVVVTHAQIPLQPSALSPPAPQPSDLRVRVEPIGRMPTHRNPTSPTPAGDVLLLVDQAGSLYRWDGTTASSLLTQKTLPAGVTPLGAEWLLNVAADRTGTRVFVMYVSSTTPKDVPRRPSPRDPDGWYVLFEYRFDGTTLTAPRAVAALQMRSEGHTGGGLAVTDDGAVLFAVGDNGDSFEDGREHGQSPQTHLAKIVRIAPEDGAVTVLALGVRSPQRLSLVTIGGERWLVFADPGGWVSEEVNAVRLGELRADAPPNFGWGRHPDGKGREGTLVIDRLGNAVAKSPPDEPGFVQPVAEFGRGGQVPVAVSGPVHSAAAFARISLLFGDLVTGRVFATTGPLTERRQAVHEVTVVGPSGAPTTLAALAGDSRPDPRFFTYPDGSAGVLLERTGEFYRVTELR